MRADNTHHLRQAARNRHEATTARAKQALRQLDQTGQPVTFGSVAAAAGVSRAWLYRQPTLRAQIERLRAAHGSSTAPQPPAAQRGTDDSRQRRIETLLEDNAQLRAHNAELHEHIARLLGERRTSQIHPSS